MYTYMQACTLYRAGKLESVQQAVHIQQLLHMLPRDLKCLFNGIEMKQQLNCTILLPIAVDCRQRLKITYCRLHSRTKFCNRLAQCRRDTLTIVWRWPEKGLHKSCGRRGEQAQYVYGVQPSGEIYEELQHLLPACQTPHLYHIHINVRCELAVLHTNFSHLLTWPCTATQDITHLKLLNQWLKLGTSANI